MPHDEDDRKPGSAGTECRMITQERLAEFARWLEPMTQDIPTMHHLKDALRKLFDGYRFLTEPVTDEETADLITKLERRAIDEALSLGNPALVKGLRADTNLIRRLQSTINQQRAEIETARREALEAAAKEAEATYGSWARSFGGQDQPLYRAQDATKELIAQRIRALIENEKERT